MITCPTQTIQLKRASRRQPHEAARVFFIKNFGTVTENSNFQEYTAHNQITTTANTTHTDLGMGAVFIGAYEYATVARPTIENYLAEPKVNPSTLAIGMTAISALIKGGAPWLNPDAQHHNSARGGGRTKF